MEKVAFICKIFLKAALFGHFKILFLALIVFPSLMTLIKKFNRQWNEITNQVKIHWSPFVSQSKFTYHLSTCKLLNKIRADRRVKSLKPHCVSRTPRTANSHTKKWKPYIKSVLKNVLVATDSSSKWALDPHDTAIASLSVFSSGNQKSYFSYIGMRI